MYGTDFEYMWKNPPDYDKEEWANLVTEEWSVELGKFFDIPEDIKYALENLPERIPNLQQFVALCKKGPRSAQMARPEAHQRPAILDEPRPCDRVLIGCDRKAERLDEVKALAGKLVNKTGPSALPGGIHKEWAWRLKARADAGEKLSAFQRDCWKSTLAPYLTTDGKVRDCPNQDQLQDADNDDMDEWK